MNHTNPGGRPKGVVRRTNIQHGAYSENLDDVLSFWKKHQPGNAARVEEIITSCLRHLGWEANHPRFNEIRDLAIRTVSRGMLFMKVLEDDYIRIVKDPITRVEIKKRPADQLVRLEELDIEIQERIAKLGLYSTVNKRRRQI